MTDQETELAALREQVAVLPGMNGRQDAIGGALEVNRAEVLALIDRAALAANPPEPAREMDGAREALRAYQRAVMQVPGIEDGRSYEPWQERLRRVIQRYGGVR